MLREADEYARRLSKEKKKWVEPLAFLIRAGTDALRGDSGRAAEKYKAAANAFDEVDMALHAAVARWRLGELIGGNEGADLIHEAETWMRRENIAHPERWTAMLTPVSAKD